MTLKGTLQFPWVLSVLKIPGIFVWSREMHCTIANCMKFTILKTLRRSPWLSLIIFFVGSCGSFEEKWLEQTVFFSRNLQYRRYSSHQQTQLAPNKKRHKTRLLLSYLCQPPPKKKTNLWLFFICRHINSLLFPYFSSTKEHRLVEQKYQTFLYTSRCGQTNVNMTRGVWWVTDVLMFQLLIGW